MRIPPVASISTALSGAVSWRPTAAMRLSSTRTSPCSITPDEGSLVNTVALRNTTGRPDGTDLPFTDGFWLMLLTSLCSGCKDAKQVSSQPVEGRSPRAFIYITVAVLHYILQRTVTGKPVSVIRTSVH